MHKFKYGYRNMLEPTFWKIDLQNEIHAWRSTSRFSKKRVISKCLKNISKSICDPVPMWYCRSWLKLCFRKPIFKYESCTTSNSYVFRDWIELLFRKSILEIWCKQNEWSAFRSKCIKTTYHSFADAIILLFLFEIWLMHN